MIIILCFITTSFEGFLVPKSHIKYVFLIVFIGLKNLFKFICLYLLDKNVKQGLKSVFDKANLKKSS